MSQQPDIARKPASGAPDALTLEPTGPALHSPALTDKDFARPGASRYGEPERPAGIFKAPRALSLPWLIASLGVFAFAILIAWVWWQTRPRGIQTGPTLAAAPPHTDAQKVSAPAPSASTAAPARSAAPADPVLIATPKLALSAPIPSAARQHKPGTVRKPRSLAPSPANTSLESGYAHYMEGDLKAARFSYLEALHQDPRSTDAFNGLAAIALARGATTEAAGLFEQALRDAPQDPTALAGLASLTPGDSESRLLRVLAEHPDSATALSALASLMTRQGRWREAQQAWFRALTLAPGNPDFLFNLAVALDHIGQGGAACGYYEQALAAAQNRPARFNHQTARERLQALPRP